MTENEKAVKAVDKRQFCFDILKILVFCLHKQSIEKRRIW